jgi:hypothetical protein
MHKLLIILVKLQMNSIKFKVLWKKLKNNGKIFKCKLKSIRKLLKLELLNLSSPL